MRGSIPMVGLLMLAGCASTGSSRYDEEYARLVESCRERGGILAPTGSQSGRPQTDNVCRLTGNPSPRVGD